MTGTVGILNVGAGDTKLSFDPRNPAERIRAARIVRDMIRRGYALLVEVAPGQYQRATDFDEARCEYIIADFDPVTAAEADSAEDAGTAHEEEPSPAARCEGAGKARRVPRRVAAMSDKESTMDDTLTTAELHDLLARSRAERNALQAEVERLREALTEIAAFNDIWANDDKDAALRKRAALAALTGLLANEAAFGATFYKHTQGIAEASVAIADALVARLKEVK